MVPATPFGTTKTLESRFQTNGLTRPPRPLYSAGFTTPRLPAGVANAPVAELVDALDSKSSSARSAGSIPARGTNQAVQARSETSATVRTVLGKP